jgi:tetratricopeptide (TPR) repeat protein
LRARVTTLVVAAVLLTAAAYWWWGAAPEPSLPSLEPEPIPMGETVEQALPGPDGEAEVWRLSKREAPREELARELLPAPAPRDDASQPATESARALNAQAMEAWKVGELIEAIELFEAAVRADPDDWAPKADYGRLLVMLTDYEKAGPMLERAAELNPDSPRVWLDLYSYYQRNMQLERGFHAYARAQELAAGQPIVQDPPTGLWRLESDSIYP